MGTLAFVLRVNFRGNINHDVSRFHLRKDLDGMGGVQRPGVVEKPVSEERQDRRCGSVVDCRPESAS